MITIINMIIIMSSSSSSSSRLAYDHRSLPHRDRIARARRASGGFRGKRFSREFAKGGLDKRGFRPPSTKCALQHVLCPLFYNEG